MKRTMRILASAMLLALAPAAVAQTTTGTSTSTPTKPEDAIASPGQSRVASRLAFNFAALAGSKENALALVNALRNGTEVTLVTAPPPGSTGDPVSTTFQPPTGHMGWGNVSHALALAQASLARAGITNPTNAELQAALMGGDVTAPDGSTVTLKGILQMRADGMGWGRIAQATGAKMGAVVSSTKGMQPKETTMAAAAKPGDGAMAKKSSGVTTAAGSSVATSAKGASKGITTASGVAPSSASKGLVTAAGGVSSNGRSSGVTTAGSGSGSGNGYAYGRGLVTASGGSVGTGAAAAAASRGQGAGLVSASGASSSSAASVSTAAGPGNGHGNGNARGVGKGNGG
jgi:hypothetical protein